jgi:regulator of sigma E protease
MGWLLTFLGIVALIVLHELGHFAVAKAVGMRVERFSLFFPPRIFGVRRGETEYMLGAIPLGGYVKIGGMGPVERLPTPSGRSESSARPLAQPENDPDAGMADPRDYFNQPVWKRVAVIAAGPAMNVLVAFLILWGVYAFSSYKPATRSHAQIAAVVPGSPAAGVLRKGDLLVAVEGHPVRLHGGAASFTSEVGAHHCAGTPVEGCRATSPVHLTVLRGSQRLSLSVVPRYDTQQKRTLVGFEYLPAREGESAIDAMGSSVKEMWHVTAVTVGTIGRIFTSERAREQVHGIVGVSDVTSEAFTLNTASALFILALLSLSLAIVNLFPFLPLDGGHIFWALAEKVRGRAIPYWVMERASVVGILLVGFVFIIGLSNDIHSLSNGSLTLHR